MKFNSDKCEVLRINRKRNPVIFHNKLHNKELNVTSAANYLGVTEHHNMRFACPLCPCTYASNHGLNSHVKLIHEKQSRYRCETCGKGMVARSRYLDHIATHAGVKRHVCPICQMYFTHKSSLTDHVLRVHPN